MMFAPCYAVPRLRWIFPFILLLVALLPRLVAAQTPPLDPYTAGRHYLLAFPDTTATVTDPKHPPQQGSQFLIYVFSATDSNAVAVTGAAGTTSQMVGAGKFTQFAISNSPVITQMGTPVANTIEVIAQDPVIVYCYMVTPFGAEAWTPLPVEAWGNDYYTAARQSELLTDYAPSGNDGPAGRRVQGGNQIVVIAQQDSTRLKIFPNGQLAGFVNTSNLVLMAGEAFMVQGLADTATGVRADLGGSFITANKPIGVLTGNTRAMGIDTLGGVTRNSLKNMAVEWLAPAEQHGDDFLFTPTADPLQRAANFVRIYGTSADFKDGYYTIDDAGNSRTFGVVNRGFFEDTNRAGKARYYKPQAPVQVMLTVPGFSRLLSSTKLSNGKTASSYETWGGFMAEITPRNQWGTFAPFITPAEPSGMEHYLSVVTDDARRSNIFYKVGDGPEQPFPFQPTDVAGSGITWGAVKVDAGKECWVRGDGPTARFGGIVYGFKKGREEWRPNQAIPEYEEEVALAYGYPLAPRRRVVGPGDSLSIAATPSGCCGLLVNAQAINQSPVGLEAIALESGAVNTTLTLVNPATPGEVLRSPAATVRLQPTNGALPARATLVFTDRTGRVTRVPFRCAPDSLSLSPSKGIDIGQVPPDTACIEAEVTAINPLQQDLPVESVRLLADTVGFRIVSVTPPVPAVLKPGELLKVKVCLRPDRDSTLFRDSLLFGYPCGSDTLPLAGLSATPCIEVDTLDFGTLRQSDEPVTLTLKICNKGTGTLTFNDDSGSGVMSWLVDNFTVAKSDLDRLKAARLIPRECITLAVTFTPTEIAQYDAWVRFQSNAGDCSDTLIWVARVISDTASAAPDPAELAGYKLFPNTPNPFSEATEIWFNLGRSGQTQIEVFDLSGKRVAVVANQQLSAGQHRHRWQSGGIPAGIYIIRITSGTWRAEQRVTVAR
ncbi:MAG: T9SS type A sorting domain-containing protein [Chlorobi bacterium]|nr:MAG: Cytochrome c554 [Chlorobi bacterium OLB7]MBK8911559.1 T9SS type A sorting domain-containing protein [Chlorobiota bacterium]MBX7215745.1 T9SS type A sorting domain-containing protein [Candidatus Kapabacteria bacterium]